MSRPVKTLQTTRAMGWKFQSVPARAAAKRKPVERMHHQLLHVESTAYGLVAEIKSLPVLKRNESEFSECSVWPRVLSRIFCQSSQFFSGQPCPPPSYKIVMFQTGSGQPGVGGCSWNEEHSLHKTERDCIRRISRSA